MSTAVCVQWRQKLSAATAATVSRDGVDNKTKITKKMKNYKNKKTYFVNTWKGRTETFGGFLNFWWGYKHVGKRLLQSNHEGAVWYISSSNSLTRVVQPCKTLQWLLVSFCRCIFWLSDYMRCVWKDPPLFGWFLDVANSRQFLKRANSRREPIRSSYEVHIWVVVGWNQQLLGQVVCTCMKQEGHTE